MEQLQYISGNIGVDLDQTVLADVGYCVTAIYLKMVEVQGSQTVSTNKNWTGATWIALTYKLMNIFI